MGKPAPLDRARFRCRSVDRHHKWVGDRQIDLRKIYLREFSHHGVRIVMVEGLPSTVRPDDSGAWKWVNVVGMPIGWYAKYFRVADSVRRIRAFVGG